MWWSVVPRHDSHFPGTGEQSISLRAGMTVKAKWRSSSLETKVFTWDGKQTLREYNYAYHVLPYLNFYPLHVVVVPIVYVLTKSKHSRRDYGGARYRR